MAPRCDSACMETTAPHISIRLATDADDRTLLRLAALDSAPAPRGSVLVADVDGEIVAARALARARSIADPFRRAAEAPRGRCARRARGRSAGRRRRAARAARGCRRRS